ncbi:MAG: NAD-dependent succinate-semialdehyde dehydrogenase [Robiginitomaculum sp.]
MPIQSRNPSTGEIVKNFTAHTDSQVDVMIGESLAAHKVLTAMGFETRAAMLRNAADILEAEAERFGAIMTLEMGKTLKAATAEAKKCAIGARYYADNAEMLLADDSVETGAAKSYRKYLPLGPVLAVMPWNYPFWQAIRFAAPALMAGNTGLLKHASNVPQCALAIEDIFIRAGFPKGAFQTLLIGSDKVERVLRDDRVKAATLTGSERAGASVAAICGQEIKPVVLELGGSDPFIVMPSADLDLAVKLGTKARTQNNGQSCIAAKRFIIHADIYDDFRARLKASFEALIVGDPMLAQTDIGPLVNADALIEVTEQTADAVNCGANLISGGLPKGSGAGEHDGYYFTPGILENIPRHARVYYEEIFGPVALLFKVDTIDAAITLANDTPFGLGSAIFSANKTEQERAINEIEAGATFVNSMTTSHPAMPFGGVKRSGFGRELGAEGIRAFCNVKTVSISSIEK